MSVLLMLLKTMLRRNCSRVSCDAFHVTLRSCLGYKTPSSVKLETPAKPGMMPTNPLSLVASQCIDLSGIWLPLLASCGRLSTQVPCNQVTSWMTFALERLRLSVSTQLIST